MQVLLWDVDGTLLDFQAAEKAAIQNLFREFSLGECTEEMLRVYSGINRAHWERLERGEITKQQVLLGRFEEFFRQMDIDPDLAPVFNARYQVALGDTVVYRDDSLAIVKALRGKVKQYVVSNGTVIAQSKKLRLSGLGEEMDGIFLSEELGIEKPSVGFFHKVFAAIDSVPRDQVLIIGDSLTSDIRGGNNAGIKTCWVNPKHAPRNPEIHVDYEIEALSQLEDQLETLK